MKIFLVCRNISTGTTESGYMMYYRGPEEWPKQNKRGAWPKCDFYLSKQDFEVLFPYVRLASGEGPVELFGFCNIHTCCYEGRES